MKKIVLHYYTGPDKSHWKSSYHKYGVFLGADLGRFNFKTQIECKKFLALVSGRLNDLLYGLNENYVTAFSMYRQLWPYLDNNQDGQAAGQEIGLLIASLERGFDRVTMYSGENHGFVVQTLLNIIRDLARWWDLLTGLYYGRSDWSGVARCGYYRGLVDSLSMDLEKSVKMD
jgi:hypothetical protein